METKILQPNNENYEYCAKLLREGEVVAIPTETVYGLGANALCEDGVKKIYEAKGRPSDNPLIVHVADFEMIEKLAYVNDRAKIVMENFMPGPITMVLKKKDIVPSCVTGGLDTVGIRMPQNEVALRLIKESGVPVCAPSANTSTRPSPTKATHVLYDLNGKIHAILDGGECKVGVESTIIDLTTDKTRLLRAGGMPVEILEEKLGKIEVVKSSTVALCPGMKYKHYSPKAPVFLFLPSAGMQDKITQKYDTYEGKAVIFALSNNVKAYGNRVVYNVGKDAEEYAHNLFDYLRKADKEEYDVILCEGVDDSGFGLGVMNRLIKASANNIIE